MSDSEVNTFLEINGWKVHYEPFGSGPNIILLIPGPIGTGRTDFSELLDGEDELDFDKFTVIAVEAPGWGRSRPPARQYGPNVYNNDSECFHGLMKHLGYDNYSIVGYDEGARVALLMATKYRTSIKSLVLSSFAPFTKTKGTTALLATKSVDKWRESRLKELIKVYETKDEVQKMWNRYLRFAEFFTQYFAEDMYKNKYQLVTCPVLITHGDKDPIIEVDQALEMSKRLPNARVHRFALGEHDSHQKYSIQYTKAVQDHILNRNISRESDAIKDSLQDQIMSNKIML